MVQSKKTTDTKKLTPYQKKLQIDVQPLHKKGESPRGIDTRYIATIISGTMGKHPELGNRARIVKDLQTKKVYTLQEIYSEELRLHRKKDIVQVNNKSGKTYLAIPFKK